MMCGAIRQQHLALDQRLAHQAEFVDIRDSAGRRGSAWSRREEVPLARSSCSHRQHRQAAAGGVARDAAAVDAAADDRDIVSYVHSVSLVVNQDFQPFKAAKWVHLGNRHQR